MEKITKLIEKYTERLEILKHNRSKSEEENWTEAQISECGHLINYVAEFIRDLKNLK